MQVAQFQTDEEKFPFKRQYPRRAISVPVGILAAGKYFIGETVEIGEGGMAIKSDLVFDQNRELVLSLQIPQGDFLFVRGVIRSVQKDAKGFLVYGLSFQEIQFAAKRQIRAYVSSRTLSKRVSK